MCVCVCGEIVEFGKCDKMIKISGKKEKPTLTTESTMIFHFLFEKEFIRMKWVFLKFSN